MSDTTAIELPRGLAVFRRSLRLVGHVELTLAAAAIVVVVALACAQSFLRYTIGASLWWAQEVSQNTIVIAYFLGISYVFKTRQYVLIEFVSSMFPLRLQIVLYLFAQILTFAFAVATLYLLYLFFPNMMNMRTPVLSLPGYVPSIPLTIGSALIAVTTAYYFAVALWAFGRGPSDASMAAWEEIGLIEKPLVEDIGEGE